MKIGNYGSVVIASPDTHIFASTLHNFCKLKYFDLEELWFVSGRGNSGTFFSIHDLTNYLNSHLVEILPAIHALTGIDTASKFGTNSEVSGKELIVTTYCMHLEFDTERFRLTSNMRQQILRTYLQCYIWLHSAFLENIDLDPLE